MLTVVNVVGSATYNKTPDTIMLGIIPPNLPTKAPPINA